MAALRPYLEIECQNHLGRIKAVGNVTRPFQNWNFPPASEQEEG